MDKKAQPDKITGHGSVNCRSLNTSNLSRRSPMSERDSICASEEKPVMVRTAQSQGGITPGVTVGRRRVLGIPFSLGSRNRNIYWAVVVQCECGRTEVVDCGHLQQGESGSCRQCCDLSRRVHGQGGSKLYKVWSAMRGRCANPKATGYSRYGGRGISVCAEWDSSFVAFCTWATEHGWREGLQIDRINNDGNYEPGNCRIATPSQNSRNSSRSVMVRAFDVVKCIAEWAEDPRGYFADGMLS